MYTAPTSFYNPMHMHQMMPSAPSPSSTKSKSVLPDVVKILVGLTIILILGGILFALIFLPRSSTNQEGLGASLEKIAKQVVESNENIARLDREEQSSIEKNRQTFQERLLEKHRAEDRLIEQQRYEQQLSVEDQRLDRQYNITEKHRSEDRYIQQEHHSDNLIFARQKAEREFELQEKYLALIKEQNQLYEQQNDNEAIKENNKLLNEFIQEVLSTPKPWNTILFEWQVHALINRFDPLHKSLLIRFLYSIELLYFNHPTNPTLDLQGANLNWLDLDDADLELSETVRRLNYTRLALSSTSLVNASLRQLNLNEANFKGCNLTGASFHQSTISGANFYTAQLSLVKFDDANLYQTILSNTKAQQATFRGANLVEAQINSADLQRSNFQQVFAFNADFSQAELSFSDFTIATLVQLRMTDVKARSVNFNSVLATGTNFSNSILPFCNFERARLVNASFRNTILIEGNFKNADMFNVDLTGAILLDSNITITQLDSALSVANARLPNGMLGKNRNLVRNGNAPCVGVDLPIAYWSNSGSVSIKPDALGTECVFQAAAINATLEQNIDLRRYQRLIENEHTQLHIEMLAKANGILDISKIPVYANIQFLNANNQIIGTEQSTLDSTSISPIFSSIATIPCPSTAVEIHFTLVFREVNATADDIYVTVE